MDSTDNPRNTQSPGRDHCSPDDRYRARFRDASPQELVDALNSQVGNAGWVSSRASYLAALREALLASGLDCSSFMDDQAMRHVLVRLEGDKIVRVTPV
jgi:hypothetical protein